MTHDEMIINAHDELMIALDSETKDHIFTATVTFSVHSATERDAAISKIAAIDGIEEVNRGFYNAVKEDL